ncbi:hypothetical protein SAMN04488074_13637 [Lentzea albidocapillata subsp. violacea]|uniref:Uncharacterized protein n=1 Tax=Lentzea albidocapillata subsp. violacea TaxID=128104 RepID=A0A1G9YYZ0_9PSEU|nr:hypothetical protein [Lentzea albidocapillata]SDN14338.1 hypothetical protein SAMN04488074_13637 [Lentzea albidocapillata subsp. violacea]
MSITTSMANTEKDHDSDTAVGWTEVRWWVSGNRPRSLTHLLEA